MRMNRIARGVRFVAFAALAVVVLGYIVMRLWNWLTPGLFGWHAISFWQALGILLLSKILFGGFRGRVAGGMHWRRRMIERWEKMTPEEREKFREGMRGRCGQFGRSAAPDAKTVA
jgi:Ca2+/H+ antiporter, TMEM165/GDT1 family